MADTERSTVDLLRAAKERISDPERWTRGCLARDANGKPVSPEDSRATRWCAIGSVRRTAPGPFIDAEKYLVRATDVLGNHGLVLQGTWPKYEIAYINDGPDPRIPLDRHCRPAPRRHKEVLALFDRAIELAEAESREAVV